MSDLVLDSSVLIDHLRGNEETTSFLEAQGRHGVLYVPSLVAWELWKGASTPRQRSGLVDLLSNLEVDPFTAALAELAGELMRRLVGQGQRPPSFDLLIASHALLRDIPLATKDRDYRGIPGLRLLLRHA